MWLLAEPELGFLPTPFDGQPGLMFSNPSTGFLGQSFLKEILGPGGGLLSSSTKDMERKGLQTIRERMEGVWEWESLRLREAF